MSEGYGTAAPQPPSPSIGPEQAVRRGFQKYADFSGRATLPEFWWFALAVFVAGIVTNIIDAITGIPILSLVLLLAVICPYIAVGIRRLHDTNRSGWFILLGLIPCLGFFIMIYLYVQPSTPGPNDYGPPST